MKKIIILLCCLLSIAATALAADDRWVLAGRDDPNQNYWYVDNKTVKIQGNKTVLFWAKVVLNAPKYDINEIKLKYLISADKLQLTKMQEIGYSDKGEVLWNNNATKTISVIPGSGHEKLVEFISKLIDAKEKAAKEEAERKAKEENKTKVVDEEKPKTDDKQPELKASKSPTDNAPQQNTQQAPEPSAKVNDKTLQQPAQHDEQPAKNTAKE